MREALMLCNCHIEKFDFQTNFSCSYLMREALMLCNCHIEKFDFQTNFSCSYLMREALMLCKYHMEKLLHFFFFFFLFWFEYFILVMATFFIHVYIVSIFLFCLVRTNKSLYLNCVVIFEVNTRLQTSKDIPVSFIIIHGTNHLKMFPPYLIFL